MRRWKTYGERQFAAAMEDNLNTIAVILAKESTQERFKNDPLRVLDLGCWDGLTTRRYVPQHAVVVGVEANRDAAERAGRNQTIEPIVASVEHVLPLDEASFDAVTSNQVLEHLSDTDTILAEAHRVLRPNGLLVVSTENLASWHNIAALLVGWQAFSLTNVTDRAAGLGNPLANQRHGEPPGEGWHHRRIFSYQGLKELVQLHGFAEATVVGAGYYPFPRAVAHIDPRHAALITVVARKPPRPTDMGLSDCVTRGAPRAISVPPQAFGS
jgi:SAM-dependent methyltransferase